MRESATERSQSRQQKLDGIVAWHFDYVRESLSLILQAALFLLGCALSLYLWEINTVVASVTIEVTSFGAICYFSLLLRGRPLRIVHIKPPFPTYSVTSSVIPSTTPATTSYSLFTRLPLPSLLVFQSSSELSGTPHPSTLSSTTGQHSSDPGIRCKMLDKSSVISSWRLSRWWSISSLLCPSYPFIWLLSVGGCTSGHLVRC